MTNVDLVALHKAARRALTADWIELRSSHPDDEIYGFGFLTHEAHYFYSAAFTEQGLAEVVDRYLPYAADPKRPYYAGMTADDFRILLRWSPGDSPRRPTGGSFGEAQALLDQVGAEFHEMGRMEVDEEVVGQAWEEWVDTVYEVLAAVLIELSDEGLFGSPRSIVLNIWQGDQSSEDREKWARALNPADLAERFSAEERASYDVLPR